MDQPIVNSGQIVPPKNMLQLDGKPLRAVRGHGGENDVKLFEYHVKENGSET